MTRHLVWVLALVACESVSETPKPIVPRDARPIDADFTKLPGRATYVALCSPCHGADAQGYAADHSPSLVNPTFLESATDGFLSQSIQRGRPGTSMAAYGKAMHGPLDDESVIRLVAYLRSQGPAAVPLPTAPKGDPARGAPLYAKLCQTCHGDTKVHGEAPQLGNSQFLAIASDAFIRHAIVHGRPGTKMVPWPLPDADVDDIVAFVRGFAAPLTVTLPQLPPPTGTEPLVINPKGKAPSFTVRADPCPPAKPGTPPCKEDPRFVSADQVAKALAEGRKMIIIDARPPSEWMRVHVAGAVSIPYHDMKRLDEIPNDTWVLTYCACPHHLSGIVLDELRKKGHKNAAILDEGITEWHRRHYPVVAAEGVEPPPPLPANKK